MDTSSSIAVQGAPVLLDCLAGATGPPWLIAAAAAVVAAAGWALWQAAVRHTRKRADPTLPARLQAASDALEVEFGKRRAAEARATAAGQSLDLALGALGAGFIATDRHGRVTRLNAVAQQLTAWHEDDARGRSLWEVFDREGRPASYLPLNPVDLMVDQGVSVDLAQHLTIIARDGLLKDLEVQAGVLRGDDQRAAGMAIVIRDTASLRQSRLQGNLLAAIVDSSDEAIIGKTLDGRITSWNRGAEAIFGYTAAEAIGQSVSMLIPPQRQAEEMRILADLARGSSIVAFDTERLTRDGRTLQVCITISPIRDDQGRIVGASKIARDVSSERRAQSALRESEARLRFTVESAQVGAWTYELASGRATRSPLHDRCFGYADLQPQWDFDTFIRHVHPDDRAHVGTSFHAAIAAREDWHVECGVVWPDGSTHWVSLHGSPRCPARKVSLAGNAIADSGDDDDDAPTEMSGIIADITQQRLMQDALLKTQRLEAENRQSLEANRMKSQFLANMSHELRTPLNAIIGFADLLSSGAVQHDTLKHKAFLGHIATSGRHLLQLINDLLDLSKVDSGKFEFYPEPLDLPQLVKEVCDILQTTLQRKRIVLRVEIEPGLDEIVLDAARLKQVLYNYLSNAIKFTPEQGRVTVRALADGPTHFRLEVEDTGIGIAEANIWRLFSEFQQIDGGYSKQHQGTGLGLALTRRLVRAQGGRVGVRSRLGHGSVFHAVLNRIDGSDAAAVAATRTASQPLADTPDLRLLVIEDNTSLQSRLSQGLSEAGFDVNCASTGEQAIACARSAVYDALSLDLRLPDHGGFGVLGSIRRKGASRHAPVIGMTVAATNGEVATFAIHNVLAKPLRTDEVAAAMSRFGRRGGGGAKVMVIDDDALALELMHTALQAIGLQTVCYLDGRQALREIDQQRPAAIVLDLMMPEFDGFATLNALRQLSDWRDTPVFIWTSMILTEDEYASLTRSASAILSKGGGALADMLESLARWRPTPAPVAAETST